MSDLEEPEPDGEEDDLTASGELRQRKKARTRQNFSWRQVSVLEQVFEIDPVPCPVRTSNGLLALCAPPLPPRPPDGRRFLTQPHTPACRRSVASWRPSFNSARAASKSGSRTGGKSGRRSSTPLARRRRSSSTCSAAKSRT